MERNFLKVDATDLLNELRMIVKEVVLEVLAEHKTESSIQRDVLLSVSDAADMLGVSKPTLWRWEKTGYLMPIRIGASPKYRFSDIEKLKQGTHG